MGISYPGANLGEHDMNDSRSEYMRLPGNGVRLAVSMLIGDRQRLYVCDDHVLVLRENIGTETHKKFYFEDIQALTVQSNSEQDILLVLQVGLMFFFGGIGLYLSRVFPDFQTWFYVLFGLFSGVPFILLIRNMALGPTCTVRLHTAVQAEELTALRRLKQATLSLGLLKFRIEKAQGVLAENELQGVLESGNTQATANRPRSRYQDDIRTIKPTVHRLTFFLVFVMGSTVLLDLLYRHWVKDFFDGVILLLMVCFTVAAMVKQRNSTLPSETCRWTVATMLMIVITNIVMMYASMMSLALMDDFSGSFGIQNYSKFSSVELMPWQRIIWGSIGVGYLFFGLIGLLLMQGYRYREESIDSLRSDSGSTGP